MTVSWSEAMSDLRDREALLLAVAEDLTKAAALCHLESTCEAKSAEELRGDFAGMRDVLNRIARKAGER